jgi:hypothetical protein
MKPIPFGEYLPDQAAFGNPARWWFKSRQELEQ